MARRVCALVCVTLLLCLPRMGLAGSGLQRFWQAHGASVGTPLKARACGACHGPQYRDWIGSLHAHALDAGVRAQLQASADPVWRAGCLSCHAPVSPVGTFQGAVDCAACHVRQGRRFGPPLRRYLQAGTRFHHGFEARRWFSDSRYCATCHQFPSNAQRLQGLLLENTYKEWRASPYATHGVSCQACHMPQGRHTFAGIHDPQMVRRALAWSVGTLHVGTRARLRLQVRNVGAGHDVPTYTTPRIDVRIWQVCPTGVCPGSRRRWELGRKISLDLRRQYYDTRLAPGAHAEFRYHQACQAHAQALQLEVRVRPDAAYVRFFKQYLAYNQLPPATRRLATRALRRDRRSAYVLWSRRLPLRCPS